MKTMKIQFFLVLVCLLFSNFTLEAQNKDENVYRSAMQKALDKLDKAADISALTDCRNQFERIAGKFSTKWQPVYYLAYCDVQMVYFDGKSDKNGGLLDDAKTQLDKLEMFADVDMSEVNTLRGYYYNARIMHTPAQAPDLFGKVIASYEKAIEENPENPRPVILRAFFNQYVPSFAKLKIDPAAEVAKAQELFGKEEKTIDRPYWGAYFLNKVEVK